MNSSLTVLIQRSLHKIPAYRRPLIESIIRVDHAGELAADRIYAGQLAVLSKDHKLTPIIREMWEQERNHLDEMERLITQYELRPTIFAPFCNIAGYMLGATTAFLGEKAAMACTIAVEEVIAEHYNDQISKLMADNPESNKELLGLLSRLRDEELEHHDTGIKYEGLEARCYDLLKLIIQTGCKAAITVTQKI